MKSFTQILLLVLPSLIVAAPTVSVYTRQSASTENGLTTDACKDLTLIFARGTNEAGNVGTSTGPPFFTRLRASLGTARVTVQGVNYAADFAGYFSGGDARGSTEMFNLINQAATKCPNTKIVLSGYSQGAQLVHNAAERLTAAVTARIAAVVLFGDPDQGEAVGNVPAARVNAICHDQDIICDKQGSFTTHLNYRNDAAAAAEFVVRLSGLT